jgi:hypothetical protein
VIDGANNPNYTFVRGQTYQFKVRTPNHPFWIKTKPTLGTDDAYSQGVFNNGVNNGSLTFVVPLDAPDLLYYICSKHALMVGSITIVDGKRLLPVGL